MHILHFYMLGNTCSLLVHWHQRSSVWMSGSDWAERFKSTCWSIHIENVWLGTTSKLMAGSWHWHHSHLYMKWLKIDKTRRQYQFIVVIFRCKTLHCEVIRCHIQEPFSFFPGGIFNIWRPFWEQPYDIDCLLHTYAWTRCAVVRDYIYYH